MSETGTIEIASIHKGRVNTKVKGEPASVMFVDKGDVGLALCTHDQASVFLSMGLPDFWKPGGTVIVDEDKKPSPFASKYELNAADTIAKIEAAQTHDELEALLEGEERKGVLAAAEKRSKELTS